MRVKNFLGAPIGARNHWIKVNLQIFFSYFLAFFWQKSAAQLFWLFFGFFFSFFLAFQKSGFFSYFLAFSQKLKKNTDPDSLALHDIVRTAHRI